jgi:hypothetical protein
VTERQEQALEALRAAAEEATAAGTLADFFAEVERAKTGALIAAARPGSPPSDPGKEYGLAEAAAVLGRSERWLRGRRRQLRIGYQLGGRGPWRFAQRELDRVRESARGRRGPA